ncbi:hypothetical protein [uncultured Meiothermus sp.]|uniref:hypothetical protein n=1 Tax=uncultured Meiothermus sp. TaxID=157471 RepID=UPI0026371971|nr:hypothetical protein [uncultured Meiothermus sp.]
MGTMAFKSKKAKVVYDIIRSLPPLTDAQAKQMVDAIERVTGRRHPLRPVRRKNANTHANPS